MRKNIIKILSLFAIAALGISLSACGKQKPETSGEKYQYMASFKEVDIPLVNGYVETMFADGDTLYAITSEYDVENFIVNKRTMHEISSSGEEKLYDMEIDSENNDNIRKVVKNSNGSYTFLIVRYNSMDNFDGYMVPDYSVAHYSSEFIKESESLLEFDPSAQLSYINDVIVDKEGNLYAYADEKICVFNKDGKLIKTEDAGNWIRSAFMAGNGHVYYVTYDDDYTSSKAVPINLPGQNVEQVIKGLPTNSNVRGIVEGKLLIVTENNVMFLEPEAGEKEILWDWLDMDMVDYDDSSLVANEDGSFQMLHQSWDDEGPKYEFVTIKKELIDPSKVKKEIVYGTYYLDWRIRNQIVKFNKSNIDYRIKVITYDDGEDSWEAAMDKFRMDVAQGTVFDIIDCRNFDINQVNSKGAFLDINEMIEADPEINKDDYMESALLSLQSKGKQYAIPLTFSLDTVVARKSVIGDKTVLTMDDLLALREENMDIPFIDYGTKGNVLFMSLYYSLNDYIDTEKGECHFESDQFYKLLQYADTFPKEYDDDFEYDDWGEIMSGNIHFINMSINDFDNLELYEELFAGDYCLIGYPVENLPTGNFIRPDAAVAISAKSKNKEGSWEFVKTLISEDTQDKFDYGFPVNKKSFDKKFEAAMKEEVYYDENGVAHHVGHSSWGNGNITIELGALKKDKADMLINAIETATAGSAYDDKLLSIIQEEVAPYFEGQKSAEEIAKILQSRVKIYLAEKK